MDTFVIRRWSVDTDKRCRVLSSEGIRDAFERIITTIQELHDNIQRMHERMESTQKAKCSIVSAMKLHKQRVRSLGRRLKGAEHRLSRKEKSRRIIHFSLNQRTGKPGHLKSVEQGIVKIKPISEKRHVKNLDSKMKPEENERNNEVFRSKVVEEEVKVSKEAQSSIAQNSHFLKPRQEIVKIKPISEKEYVKNLDSKMKPEENERNNDVFRSKVVEEKVKESKETQSSIAQNSLFLKPRSSHDLLDMENTLHELKSLVFKDTQPDTTHEIDEWNLIENELRNISKSIGSDPINHDHEKYFSTFISEVGIPNEGPVSGTGFGISDSSQVSKLRLSSNKSGDGSTDEKSSLGYKNNTQSVNDRQSNLISSEKLSEGEINPDAHRLQASSNDVHNLKITNLPQRIQFEHIKKVSNPSNDLEEKYILTKYRDVERNISLPVIPEEHTQQEIESGVNCENLKELELVVKDLIVNHSLKNNIAYRGRADERRNFSKFQTESNLCPKEDSREIASSEHKTIQTDLSVELFQCPRRDAMQDKKAILNDPHSLERSSLKQPVSKRDQATSPFPSTVALSVKAVPAVEVCKTRSSGSLPSLPSLSVTSMADASSLGESSVDPFLSSPIPTSDYFSLLDTNTISSLSFPQLFQSSSAEEGSMNMGREHKCGIRKETNPFVSSVRPTTSLPGMDQQHAGIYPSNTNRTCSLPNVLNTSPRRNCPVDPLLELSASDPCSHPRMPVQSTSYLSQVHRNVTPSYVPEISPHTSMNHPGHSLTPSSEAAHSFMQHHCRKSYPFSSCTSQNIPSHLLPNYLGVNPFLPFQQVDSNYLKTKWEPAHSVSVSNPFRVGISETYMPLTTNPIHKIHSQSVINCQHETDRMPTDVKYPACTPKNLNLQTLKMSLPEMNLGRAQTGDQRLVPNEEQMRREPVWVSKSRPNLSKKSSTIVSHTPLSVQSRFCNKETQDDRSSHSESSVHSEDPGRSQAQPSRTPGALGFADMSCGCSNPVVAESSPGVAVSAPLPSLGALRLASIEKAKQSRRARRLGMKLIRAAEGGQVYLVRKLLEDGADVNAANRSRWTALHVAARKGYVRILSQLLVRGADVEARSLYGFTALHVAAYYDFTGRCAARLAVAGADVNSRNTSQRTPLQVAASCGNLVAVAALWNAGAANDLSRRERMDILNEAVNVSTRSTLARATKRK